MERITPNCYIYLRKKICNATMLHTIHRLAGEWGLSPEETCYKLLNEATMREYYHKKEVDALKIKTA